MLNPDRSHRLLLFCLLAVAVSPTLGAHSLPVPVAPPPAHGPVSEFEPALQARYIEAESKARLFAKLSQVEALATPNMDLYDAVHYDLDLELTPSTGILDGTVTLIATVTGASLTQLDLDLRDHMTVSQALSGGIATTFSHAGHILTVDLDRTYTTGELVTVTVIYSGDPSGSYFGWDSYGGYPLIWTLSEPYGARHWWPCKDLNSDKPDSVDIRVTVPDGLIVASNGLLVSEVDNGATRTFHWHEGYPIATYLVSLAIHPYEIFSHWYHFAPDDSMEVVHYVLPDKLADAQVGYAVTVPMIEAFAGGFGEYPFVDEKYGHAHFPWGGGMEHQTCSSMGSNIYFEWFIAHELAHQWWGDLITCDDFQHVWLNEGFATWSEAYWREVNEGPAAYHDEMMAAVYTGGGTIYVEDPSNFGEIFDWYLSYLKGSWVVHMLRHVLGDDDFFASLQAYRAAHGYGSATTEQLRDICEAVSGQDLDAFFQQWIYGEYHPQYRFSWYDLDRGDSTQVNLLIEQIQTNTGLFVMPIDVTVTTDSGTFDFVVQNSLASEAYALMVTGQAQTVQLDKDDWILKSISETTVDVPAALVTAPALLPNRPNPFNPATTIAFVLPAPAEVRLRVYDIGGRLIKELAAGEFDAGEHHVVWDGTDSRGGRIGSGLYFTRLDAAGFSRTRKMTMVK